MLYDTNSVELVLPESDHSMRLLTTQPLASDSTFLHDGSLEQGRWDNHDLASDDSSPVVDLQCQVMLFVAIEHERSERLRARETRARPIPPDESSYRSDAFSCTRELFSLYGAKFEVRHWFPFVILKGRCRVLFQTVARSGPLRGSRPACQRTRCSSGVMVPSRAVAGARKFGIPNVSAQASTACCSGLPARALDLELDTVRGVVEDKPDLLPRVQRFHVAYLPQHSNISSNCGAMG